jgi:acid phosphatase class B
VLAVAVATKATAVAAVVVVVVADMAAALAAKAPVAVVAVDVDAVALAATVDRLGVKRFWSVQEKGLCRALFYARKNSVNKGSGPTWRLQWP